MEIRFSFPNFPLLNQPQQQQRLNSTMASSNVQFTTNIQTARGKFVSNPSLPILGDQPFNRIDSLDIPDNYNAGYLPTPPAVSNPTYNRSESKEETEPAPIQHAKLVRIAFMLLFHILNPIAFLASALVALPTMIVTLVAKCAGSNACTGISSALAGLDIGLANFVGRHCLMQTRKMRVDQRIRDTRSLSVLLYMLSGKLISAEISLLALLLTQALPMYAMGSKGGDFGGYLGDSFNFDDKPVVYAVVVVVGYGIGWVCVFLGAPVSVKLTRKFCAAE